MKIGDKEFACKICTKKLKSYQALGGHMIQMHKKRKCLKQSSCENVFK